MWRLFAIALLCSCVSTQAPAPLIWNGLQPGSHDVGFHSETFTSAPYPLQVSFWYPADGGGDALTWRDLFLLSLSDTSGVEPTTEKQAQEVAAYKSMIATDGVAPDAIEQLLSLRFLARRDPPMRRQRYPLVLIAQGSGQSAVHQAVLAEYLASHGVVVATVPSITRLTSPPSSDGDVVAKAAEEAANLERALTAATKRRDVDASRVAVVGYSFGARSALVLAMRTPMRALVSLDGGIGTARGVSDMPSATVPLPPILHIYETGDERMKPELTYIRSLPAQVRVEHMTSLKHTHFSSIGYAAGVIPPIATTTRAGSELQKDVRFMAETTLTFLKTRL